MEKTMKKLVQARENLNENIIKRDMQMNMIINYISKQIKVINIKSQEK